MKTQLLILILVVSVLALSGCGNKTNNALNPVQPPTIRKMSVAEMANFQWISDNILVPKCNKCHSGPNPPHGVDLTTYDNIINSTHFPPLVAAGNPDGSLLYAEIARGDMPKNAPKLSDEEIQAIGQWIHDGAHGPNNEAPPSVASSEPCDVNAQPGEPGEPCHPH